MNDAASIRRTLAAFLVGLSIAGLLAGAISPIGAKLHDPFLAYGIVLVSLPAWAVGTAAGAIATLAAPARPLRRRALTFTIANIVTAAVVVLVVPFHAS